MIIQRKDNLVVHTQHLNFHEIRRESGLTSRQVADAANVPLRDEYMFEIGGVISHDAKEKVIQALSILTNHQYVLSDFEPVPVSDETVCIAAISFPPQIKGAK